MNEFLFGIYPYIAVTVMFLGSAIRYERDPFTWKSSSSQLLRRKQLVVGSSLFHVGILIVIFGHIVGMLTPIQIIDALGVGHGFKQVLAIVVGGIAGVMALVGGAMLFHRRWSDPRIRKTSSRGDIAILGILLIQLVLGLLTIFSSVGHLDGHEMTKFMAWAWGIVTFDSQAASYVADVALIFKVHMVLGLTIFVLVPFTRLVHIASAPIRYIWRPGYQIVRSRRAGPAE